MSELYLEVIKNLSPKLVVPIYSMRSYETGEYSILKDGNFKHTMAKGHLWLEMEISV